MPQPVLYGKIEVFLYDNRYQKYVLYWFGIYSELSKTKIPKFYQHAKFSSSGMISPPSDNAASFSFLPYLVWENRNIYPEKINRSGKLSILSSPSYYGEEPNAKFIAIMTVINYKEKYERKSGVSLKKVTLLIAGHSRGSKMSWNIVTGDGVNCWLLCYFRALGPFT